MRRTQTHSHPPNLFVLSPKTVKLRRENLSLPETVDYSSWTVLSPPPYESSSPPSWYLVSTNTLVDDLRLHKNIPPPIYISYKNPKRTAPQCLLYLYRLDIKGWKWACGDLSTSYHCNRKGQHSWSLCRENHKSPWSQRAFHEQGIRET